MVPDIYAYLHYRAFLNAWCDAVNRSSRGPSPSARAQKVGISSGMLANLRRNRVPSATTSKRLIDMMGLDEQEAAFFHLLVKKERARSDKSRSKVLQEIFAHPGLWRRAALSDFFPDGSGRLDLDILEMKNNNVDFQPQVDWICQHLALSAAPDAVTAALERLTRKGLLSPNPNHTTQHFTTPPEAPVSLRQAHFDGLELAARALEEIPQQQRGFYLTYLPLSDNGLTQVKAELVELLNKQLHRAQESPRDDTRTYRVQIQIFPVDQDPPS